MRVASTAVVGWISVDSDDHVSQSGGGVPSVGERVGGLMGGKSDTNIGMVPPATLAAARLATATLEF